MKIRTETGCLFPADRLAEVSQMKIRTETGCFYPLNDMQKVFNKQKRIIICSQ